jgi:cellulose synthase/poly-beta-1,6-N-acetylglucosamine synthase-like glycosyltransferase
MPIIKFGINVLLLALQLLIFAGLVYYYLLLFGGTRRSHKAGVANIKHSFAVLIPAHNEEAVLERTLTILSKQDYPRDRWEVYVIADYCEDRTVEVARQNGAICYERTTGQRGRKAYPLAWGIEQVLHSERVYDAFVVLDADSRLSSDFLKAMNNALAEGYRALQGQHVILNPQDSSFAALAEVDMRLNNFLHNRAKCNLGLSARLMGDAMVFTSDLMREYGWPTGSLGEDREYGLFLVERGVNIYYVPGAVSQGQAPVHWGDATKQRLRWYGGVFHIRREFGFGLLRTALSSRNWSALDLAIELLLPSFSVFVLLSIAVLGLCLVLKWIGLALFLPLWISLASAGLWGVFPFLALLVDGAPLSVFRAIIHAPAYLLWRVGVGLKVWFKRGRVNWVRTKRREETQEP